MAAIDQATAEAALAFGELVEVNLGGVLVQPGGELMLGLFDRHAVDMVDLLARQKIAPAIRRAGQGEVIFARVDHRAGVAELVGRERARQLRRDFGRRRRFGSRLRTMTQRTYSSTARRAG